MSEDIVSLQQKGWQEMCCGTCILCHSELWYLWGMSWWAG